LLSGRAAEIGTSAHVGHEKTGPRTAFDSRTGEEERLDVEVTGLIGVYTNPHHVMAYTDGEVRQQFSLCFTTRLLGGDLLADSESTDIAWTPSRDIPSLNMHPSMRVRIQHYLEHHGTPYLG
jgi:ADP-ribose pyrophosphatase YjhB (NUDIX family)